MTNYNDRRLISKYHFYQVILLKENPDLISSTFFTQVKIKNLCVLLLVSVTFKKEKVAGRGVGYDYKLIVCRIFG